MAFGLMFHDAVNRYGWQRRAQYECREMYGYPDYDQKLKDRIDLLTIMAGDLYYSTVNNAEFVPEISNDFVMDYTLEEKGNNKYQLSR